MPRRGHTILLLTTAVLVLAFVLAVLLDRPSSRRPAGSSTLSSGPSGQSAGSEFDGAPLPPNVPAHDFTLTDQSGRPVSLADYRGRVVVLAFVYTGCGSTCVVVSQQIRGALDELPHPPPVLFLSLDPTSDTPARVAHFLAQASLTGRARYLTGSLSTLAPVWHAYGAVPASAGSNAVDRAASVLLIDSHGLLRVVLPVEQLTPESLAHDVRRLQSGA